MCKVLFPASHINYIHIVILKKIYTALRFFLYMLIVLDIKKTIGGE